MFLSSSCVLVMVLCLSYVCNGRHLSSIDEHAMDAKANLLSHSTIKGLGNDPFSVHDDPNFKKSKKGKDQTNNVDDDHHKQIDCGSKNKKDTIKDKNLKKSKEGVHRHRDQHQPMSNTFRVPPKNKRVHQQPGFNLDYSPPKTHPPSHN
ncbi:hypothetical protein Tco_1068088 [Tanacetum coccineum]|uniref:Uncharacterized protein n=1 Tax=Tanacetum coccineum TaxID=301880 RepID=A0ABQ5HET6_9ASTR